MKKWALLCALVVILGCGGLGSGGDDSAPSPFKDFFVYLANQSSNNVSIMQGDADGKLTACGTMPVGSQPSAIVYDGRRFLFVANTGDNTISCFKVAKSGNIYLQATVPTGSFPNGLALGIGGSSGYQLFVTCRGDNAVRIYDIGASAHLTFKGQASTGIAPFGMVAAEGTLYVCNGVGGTISQFHIGPGTLTPLSPSTIKAGSVPFKIVWHGQAVYALNQGDSISEFQGGTIALTANGTVATPHTPTAIALDRSGRAAYVTNDTLHTVSVYKADDHLRLTRVPGIEVSGGSFPTALGVTTAPPNLDHGAVYVTDRDGSTRGYWVDQDYALHLVGTTNSGGTTPVDLAIAEDVGNEGPNAFAISTVTLPNGVKGTGYEGHLAVAGGMNTNDAYWSVSSGTLPPGLALTMDAGFNESLSGNPTQTGTYTFTLQAQQGKFRATKSFTVVVSTGSSLQISTTSLPDGQVGVAYNTPISLLGGDGTQTATWSVTSGALPPGLSLKTNPATNQTLFGTPTITGNFALTLRATQGTLMATHAFTMAVTTTTPTLGRFFNMCTGSTDQTLSLSVAGASFTSLSHGAFSPQVSGLLGSPPALGYTVTTGTGSTWPAGTISVIPRNRNIFVALGSKTASRMLVDVNLPLAFPGATSSGIVFVDGIDPADVLQVDIELLDAAGNHISQGGGLEYGQWQDFTVPPGTYRFKVTKAGNPGTVIVTGPLQDLVAGADRVNVAVSPGDWGANFVQFLEHP